MKTKQILVYGFFAVILALAFTACSKSGGGGSSGGGGKSLNSATELMEYLDKQPANSTDQPIKVAMKANDMMIKDIVEVLNNAGKYVSLDLSGSPLTTFPERAFRNCKTLVGITIPNGVTNIGYMVFAYCTNLASVTIPNSVTTIESIAFDNCTSLASITIPNSVTTIKDSAFQECPNLTSVTFQGTIASDNLGQIYSIFVAIRDIYETFVDSPFPGDLRDKYLAGGIGTYTTTAPVNDWNSVWTKQ